MPESISNVRMGELLAQLCAALGKPFGTKGEKMVAGYRRGLEDWPDEAIEWAVWRACKTWKARAFPKPAELADLCAQSPHKRLEPELPAEPVVSEVERCRECGEWWAWHRQASLLLGSAHLVHYNGIRHLDSCPRHRGQDRELRFYSRSWVDGPPLAGALERGDPAWTAPGVLQLIYPLPPLPPAPTRRRAKDAPTPIGEVQAEDLEQLVPVAPPNAGDAWEPPAPAAEAAR